MADGIEVFVNQEFSVFEDGAQQIFGAVSFCNSMLIGIGQLSGFIAGNDAHTLLGLLVRRICALIGFGIFEHEYLFAGNNAVGDFERKPKRIPGHILISVGAKPEDDVVGGISLPLQPVTDFIR